MFMLHHLIYRAATELHHTYLHQVLNVATESSLFSYLPV